MVKSERDWEALSRERGLNVADEARAVRAAWGGTRYHGKAQWVSTDKSLEPTIERLLNEIASYRENGDSPETVFYKVQQLSDALKDSNEYARMKLAGRSLHLVCVLLAARTIASGSYAKPLILLPIGMLALAFTSVYQTICDMKENQFTLEALAGFMENVNQRHALEKDVIPSSAVKP